MEEKELTPRGSMEHMEKQSRRPDWGGGSVLLSDGALYGALGQGQIILVHIYRVLEGGCAGPRWRAGPEVP